MNQIIDVFKNVFNQAHLEVKEEHVADMAKFFEFLMEENKHYNLTAINTPVEAAIRHFTDSLMLSLSKEFLEASTILDVGSGAGFPGIPLAINYPNKEFTLLDSLQKRINFLTNSADLLGLRNVNCIHQRAETFTQLPDFREQYEVVTARAVADLSILAEYCLPAVKCGGYFIAMKSLEIENELSNAQAALNLLGGGKLEVIEYCLPDGRERQLIIVEKIKNTPKKYPRRPGMPKKRPIS